MLRKFPFEGLIWLLALLYLALRNPTQDPHFSLCPIKNLGWSFCPGCGLGQSITLLFHGELIASFNMHPLGIFAVIILSFRTFTLFNQFAKRYGKGN